MPPVKKSKPGTTKKPIAKKAPAPAAPKAAKPAPAKAKAPSAVPKKKATPQVDAKSPKPAPATAKAKAPRAVPKKKTVPVKIKQGSVPAPPKANPPRTMKSRPNQKVEPILIANPDMQPGPLSFTETVKQLIRNMGDSTSRLIRVIREKALGIVNEPESRSPKS